MCYQPRPASRTPPPRSAPPSFASSLIAYRRSRLQTGVEGAISDRGWLCVLNVLGWGRPLVLDGQLPIVDRVSIGPGTPPLDVLSLEFPARFPRALAGLHHEDLARLPLHFNGHVPAVHCRHSTTSLLSHST